MKETEFQQALKELNFNEGLVVPVYYRLDDEGNVDIDFDSINEEVAIKLDEVMDILDPKN